MKVKTFFSFFSFVTAFFAIIRSSALLLTNDNGITHNRETTQHTTVKRLDTQPRNDWTHNHKATRHTTTDRHPVLHPPAFVSGQIHQSYPVRIQEGRIQEHIGISICHLNANASTSAHKLPRERSYFPSRALDNIKRCTPYQILVYTFFRFAVHLSARRCTPFSIYDRSCEHLRPFMRQNICGRVAIYRTLPRIMSTAR